MLLTDARSDFELAAEAAAVVARPRADAANSFVLHAPLELAARLALLPLVAPEAREEARARVSAVATEFEAFGPAVDEPAQRDFDAPAAAAAQLADAIAAGELDDVDAIAAWLGRAASPAQLAELLADEVIPRLSAAAHAPIFLYHLPRVAPRGELTPELLRPLVRELARYPDWRLTWMDDHAGSTPLRPEALFEAIQATPHLGIPGSDFIFPLMSQVERAGTAAGLLAGPARTSDFAAATNVVLRSAAWSMLQEPPDHAPYGWSHCLTMPQAVLGIAHACADPFTPLAVAATYVVGFRAALATRPLVAGYKPEDPGIDLHEAFEQGPEVAAAAAWHARGDVVTAIATRAAVHPDAHLVKYTLACLDAAATDRTHTRLYMAAAASLVGFWSR